ncbi:MAG TPA: transcriptional regulator [Pseudonocardiaceae bacterium]
MPLPTRPGTDSSGNLPDGEIPVLGGEQALRVDPSSVPELRRAFEAALSRLDPQVDLAITDLRIRPWAGDPISAEATDQFNRHSIEGPEAALTALRNYQSQLKAAADALREVEEQYRRAEDDNLGMLRHGRHSGER